MGLKQGYHTPFFLSPIIIIITLLSYPWVDEVVVVVAGNRLRPRQRARLRLEGEAHGGGHANSFIVIITIIFIVTHCYFHCYSYYMLPGYRTLLL